MNSSVKQNTILFFLTKLFNIYLCGVEVRRGRHTFYMKADCPDWVTLGARALKHQQMYGSNIMAEELYKRLPVIHPTVTELVIKHPTEPSGFKFRSEEELTHSLPSSGTTFSDLSQGARDATPSTLISAPS